MMHSVGITVNGSTNAVSACGSRSMSLSLMACQPRMLEPSKPRPSSKTSSSSLETGIVKCCQMPGKSMNRMSIALISRSRHIARTVWGVIAAMIRDLQNACVGSGRGERRRSQLGGHDTESGGDWKRLGGVMGARTKKPPASAGGLDVSVKGNDFGG